MNISCDIYTFEALAHFMRGAITMFFIFWSVILWKYRNRNRMMHLMHLASILLAICYLKDIVFVFYDWKYSEYLNNMTGIIDVVYLPVIAAFFLEVTNPGIVNNKQMYGAMVCQAAFIPIYILFPYDEVCIASSILAYSISVTTVIYVHIFVIRYRKRMFETFSYTENIDVQWVLFSCYAYFLSHILYSIAFEFTTWISETVFNMIGMLLWLIVFKMACKHRILRMLFGKAPANDGTETETDVFDSSDTLDEVPDEALYSDNESIILDDNNMIRTTKQIREKHIASLLPKKMEEKKLYLNPKLTIVDIAVVLGTNKTYLSDYLNNTLKVTFHDYVNQFRIKEACMIINNMDANDKLTMVEVATKSGFNSISSFNRYFSKIEGISPRQYLIDHLTR